jgi:hypothetical protein
MAKSKPAPPQDTVARKLTPTERLDALHCFLRSKIETSRAVVDTLAKDLADPERRPLEVLSWSARAFEAAAMFQIALAICERLDAGESIADVHAWLGHEALRGARSGSSSTSPTSNFAVTCRTAALAEFEDFLRYDATKA